MPITRWTSAATALTATVLFLGTGCSSSESTPPTAAPATSTPAGTWSAPQIVDAIHTTSAPAFPTTLSGWELAGSWTDQPRAFTDQWTSVAGPDHGEFPGPSNGCASGRFLFRWRTLGVPVLSASVYPYAGEDGPLVETSIPAGPAAAQGWADLNWCTDLGFQVPPAPEGGSTLTDLIVEVQYWKPKV